MDSVSQVKWRIKELLIQKNMSIYELASKADLTDACIRNWYTKRNYTPSLNAVLKICNALEISITELFRTDDDEFMCVGAEEKEVLSNWALLNEKQRKAVLVQMEAFLGK